MKLNRIIFVISLISTLGIASSIAIAQADLTEGGRRPHPINHHQAMSELKLSPEQQQLMENLRSAGKQNRKEVQALRQSLHALAQSDDYSYATADSTARQLAELQYQNMLARAEAQQALYQTFTAEQKALAKELPFNQGPRQSRHQPRH